MKFNIEAYTNDHSGWNKIVKGFGYSTFRHSSYWGSYCEKEFGHKPIPCLIYDLERNLVGICLVIANPSKNTANWSRGPLISTNLVSGELNFIINQVCHFLKKFGIYSIERFDLPLEVEPLGAEQLESFERKNYKFYQWATYLIDLRTQEEDIWRSFNSSVRKNVQKCLRMGIEVKRILSLQELDEKYLPILMENRKRLGFGLPPTYPNHNLWESFRNDDGILEVFIAEQNGETLAGLGIIGFNSKIQEIAVAQSQRCFDEKIPAQDLIKWEIIKWGAKAGLCFYDLAGVSPQPKDDKELGIRRFKEKYGGEYKTYWIFSKTTSPLRHYLLRAKSYLDRKVGRFFNPSHKKYSS